MHGWNVAEQLEMSYLKTSDLFSAGEEIQHILDMLPKLKPFDTLDIESERNRISDLFTEATAEEIMYGHFLDIKQAYITGMFKALKEYDISRNVPFIVYKEYAAMRDPRSGRLKITFLYRTHYIKREHLTALYENTIKAILWGVENPQITLEHIMEKF